jgi:hypothetical protein
MEGGTGGSSVSLALVIASEKASSTISFVFPWISLAENVLLEVSDDWLMLLAKRGFRERSLFGRDFPQQQFLYFFPDPQGQGSFRPGLLDILSLII